LLCRCCKLLWYMYPAYRRVRLTCPCPAWHVILCTACTQHIVVASGGGAGHYSTAAASTVHPAKPCLPALVVMMTCSNYASSHAHIQPGLIAGLSHVAVHQIFAASLMVGCRLFRHALLPSCCLQEADVWRCGSSCSLRAAGRPASELPVGIDWACRHQGCPSF
jgi:hypothetical protein